MSTQEKDYYKIILDSLLAKSKLTDTEVRNVLKGSYSNLNKIGGNKELKCLFPNCTNIGVERSHLFAKGFLKEFSENGKFYSKSYYPNISESNLNYSIEELGISEVMTFPGFCSICEKNFLLKKVKSSQPLTTIFYNC